MIWSITVTISDHTAPAQDIATLFKKGSQTGYTVAPATGYPGQLIPTTFGYVSIQAGVGNGSGKIFVGDANTANDGSQQGLVLAAGNGWDRDLESNRVVAQGLYVRTDTDDSTFNVMLESV
jgi:hypothetical protein